MKILTGVTVALVTATAIFVVLDLTGALAVHPDLVHGLIGLASAGGVYCVVGIVGRNVQVRLGRIERALDELQHMLAADAADIRAAEERVSEIRDSLPAVSPNGVPLRTLRSAGT